MQQVFLLSCLQAARNKSAPFLFPSSYHIKCIGHTIKVRRAACERFSGLLFAFVKYFRHFSIPPLCKAQKTSMKRNRCVIFQHPAALQGPKNLYKEGNRCVIFQHSAALKGPKTSIKRGIAVLYFSIPPPCKAPKQPSPLRQKIFMENTRISQTCRRGYLDAFRLVL